MKDHRRHINSMELKRANRHAARGHIVFAPVASKISSLALDTTSRTMVSALDTASRTMVSALETASMTISSALDTASMTTSSALWRASILGVKDKVWRTMMARNGYLESAVDCCEK